MISWTSFSNSLCAALLLTLCGCASTGSLTGRPGSAGDGTIAVLPMENSSGRPAPVADLRKLLENELRQAGVTLLDDEVMRRFMEKYRVRHTGGIDAVTAEALRKETGATRILVSSLQQYAEVPSPVAAVMARVVTAESPPAVIWSGGAALAGDGAPGILGVGIIQDPKELSARTVKKLLVAQDGVPYRPPRIFHRAKGFTVPEGGRVAVVPFLNRTDRKYAGDIVTAHLVHRLASGGTLRVVEPGELRQKLLQYRITIEEGLSLPTLEVIFNAVDADLVAIGQVTEYQEGGGPDGTPKAEFTVSVFERKTNRIIWSSRSAATGDDGVYLFDCGKIATIHDLTEAMTEGVARLLVAP